MPDEWFSVENLRKAWKYARIDMRDDFVFDIIDYQDIRDSIDERVLGSLSTQLRDSRYHPVPLLSVPVPKNDHSVRPGTAVHPLDLIVLYAIAQQIAPPLDGEMSECAYAYRLNPRRSEGAQPLFSSRTPAEDAAPNAPVEPETAVEDATEDADFAEIGFPYNWFRNWIPFHRGTQAASEELMYEAKTDVTAYFENVSLDLLFKEMGLLLGEKYRHLLDKLRALLDYWNWALAAEDTMGRGLPQGNDVSSFLSNVYLRDLDQAIAETVEEPSSRYLRYVDDVRLYTDSESEGRRALVEVERTLHTLGLNVQAAKTKVIRAEDTIDREVKQWMATLEDHVPDKLDSARRFMSDIFDDADSEAIERWQQPYSRCLTILGGAYDDRAVPTVLGLFLRDPSAKMLRKNLTYLRRFAARHQYENAICDRLLSDEFTFDYHRAFMYQLAAYSRGECSALKRLAVDHALNGSGYWFLRVGALLFLSTSRLSSRELADVSQAARREANAQVARAFYVVLCQCPSSELRQVLEMIGDSTEPHQHYLRRYLRRLMHREEVGQRVLTAVSRDDASNPFFIRSLHKLDLAKACEPLRSRYRQVLDEKLPGCQSEWPRLHGRLQGILDTFIESP